ncbi:hypothetical protein DFJ73DRAFT_760873 [Zopfochytrium polystomum]|nr:hypothetical protein DFJ73DRAFT_760873 [Zopfochytrium polystomum]
MARIPSEILLQIAVASAADLVAEANGSLAPVNRELARVSHTFRSALSTASTRLRILTLASPFPNGDIASFVVPGWPKGLTPEEREDLLLCWLDERLSRSGDGSKDAIAKILTFRATKIPPDLSWTKATHKELDSLRTQGSYFLTIAAMDNHLRLAERLLALGDSPSRVTYRETIRRDYDDMLRLLVAKSPPVFGSDPKGTVLADAASFGSLKCMRVLFSLLPSDRFGSLISGAMEKACLALDTDSITALLDLEAEFRPEGSSSAFQEFDNDELNIKDTWMMEAFSGFFLHGSPVDLQDQFIDCIKLIVDLGGSPTFALQLVSKVGSEGLLRWLIARGGNVDEVPEPARSEIRDFLGDD